LPIFPKVFVIKVYICISKKAPKCNIPNAKERVTLKGRFSKENDRKPIQKF
jgi:hypothetical protein